MAETVSDTRNIVLNMLTDTLRRGVFSHVVMNNAPSVLTARDRAFVSRLFLGVLERLIYLDHCINRVSKTRTSKMKPVILDILRMGTYQLLFMDSVPDHAAVSESVRLAKKRGFKNLAPFVNGVLRGIQRGKKDLESDMTPDERLSVPEWMYRLVASQYSVSEADSFFGSALSEDKGIIVRLNTLSKTEEEIVSSLEAEGCSLMPAGEEKCYYLNDFGALTGLKAFGEGLFSVQDISSVRAALAGCRALRPVMEKEADITAPLIVDLCAAPGGKSICAAQEFPFGTVISRDISAAKTALIDENMQRLGLKNIRSEVYDATNTDTELTGKADLVIADLPCSGIGVIGRKPDIKYRLKEQDLKELQLLQRTILSASYRYVKEGGILLYSTCTVNKEENTANAKWLSENYPFELLSEEQITEGGDGFYIAVFKRI